MKALVDLDQLEGGARAIAETMRFGDIGIIQLTAEPFGRGRLPPPRRPDPNRERPGTVPAAPRTSTPALAHPLLRAALHQLEQDALADAAIGNAQPADRPGGADRIEDGAAAQHQVGALAADAGIGGATFDVEPSEMARHQLDLIEGQHAAVDKGADVARQGEMHPGQCRYRAGTAEHLHLAGADLAA